MFTFVVYPTVDSTDDERAQFAYRLALRDWVLLGLYSYFTCANMRRPPKSALTAPLMTI